MQQLFGGSGPSSSACLAKNAVPFVEGSRHIRRRRPRLAVLENVCGLLKRCRGQNVLEVAGCTYEARRASECSC
eukprot:14129968-Alexandrium_andersonii.AAC.1